MRNIAGSGHKSDLSMVEFGKLPPERGIPRIKFRNLEGHKRGKSMGTAIDARSLP